MPKVTAKHYLNVNLKPYLIRGEKFYPVYVLITSFRKTTRVKSNTFSELQSEVDFEKLIESKEAKEEISAIELLAETINSITQKPFDTTFFSLVYNHTPNHYCVKSSLMSELYNWNKKLGSKVLDDLYFSGSFNQSGPSFYDLYTPKFQRRLKRLLTARGIKESSLSLINEAMLFAFFEILSIVILSSQKKYKSLLDRYPAYFDDYISFSKSLISKV